MFRMLFWGLRKARRLRYMLYSLITIATLYNSVAAYSDSIPPFNQVAEKAIIQVISLVKSAGDQLEIKQPTFVQQKGQTPSPTPATDVNGAGKCIVHFIDVGQGDSIFVQLPNKQTALIDGGDIDNPKAVTDYLAKQNIKKIDYLLVTHPHTDHLGSLPEIVRTYQIGKIYMPDVTSNTDVFKSLLKEIRKKGLKITPARGGMDILCETSLGFKILAPNSDKYDDVNDYSIVAKLTYGSTSYLFTGDSESTSEYEMIKHGYDLKADVIKIGHHGSSSASNNAFLKAVNKPDYAVISVGNNDYGHPHKEVLARLLASGAKILRTDQDGTIIISSDGKTLSAKTSKEK